MVVSEGERHLDGLRKGLDGQLLVERIDAFLLGAVVAQRSLFAIVSAIDDHRRGFLCPSHPAALVAHEDCYQVVGRGCEGQLLGQYRVYHHLAGVLGAACHDVGYKILVKAQDEVGHILIGTMCGAVRRCNISA